jgi:hypothetical protein
LGLRCVQLLHPHSDGKCIARLSLIDARSSITNQLASP